MIEAANAVVQAEEGEIGGFQRTVTQDGVIHRDIVLYDNVPGGAGYVRSVADRFLEVMAFARALLDGCQCERSCYKCLRSYSNQFEHKLLDKRLIQPYLDNLIVLNSSDQRARLVQYDASASRFCGVAASPWLQRLARTQGKSIFAICAAIDDVEAPQASSWVAFLSRFLSERPDRSVHLGITKLPKLDELTEANLVAVKSLVDLLDAGVKLTQVDAVPLDGEWQAIFVNEDSGLALAVLDELPMLTPQLNQQRIIYLENASGDQIVARLSRYFAGGRSVTHETLRPRGMPSYRLEEIPDGATGVTYQKLFAPYLAAAKHIRIVDPYIRAEHQVRNLEDMIQQTGIASGAEIELVTMYEQEVRYNYSGEQDSRRRLSAYLPK